MLLGVNVQDVAFLSRGQSSQKIELACRDINHGAKNVFVMLLGKRKEKSTKLQWKGENAQDAIYSSLGKNFIRVSTRIPAIHLRARDAF